MVAHSYSKSYHERAIWYFVRYQQSENFIFYVVYCMSGLWKLLK